VATITFHGAAQEVTGSCHLLESPAIGRVLLDCGVRQGGDALNRVQDEGFPFAPSSIDAVILSHVHLDHSGLLPSLVHQGFSGPILCTDSSRGLLRILLEDAAGLYQRDLEHENLRRARSGRELLEAEYDDDDVRKVLQLCQTSPYNTPVPVGTDAVLTFHDAGHILGSANHPPDDADPRLAEIIRATVGRGGSVLLPSFAVGRAQALLHSLQKLRSAGEIAREMPIFLDSPMAIEATALYQRHRRLLRLTARETAALTDGVTLVTTPQQSQRLSRHHYPCVIISASGMATGGRVLHHLKAMAPNPRHHVVFPGFQVGGTRGAALVGGAREVKIHGEYVAVKAEVSHLEGFSGHADADGLLDWLRGFEQPPERCFVVHGEAAAADTLRLRIQDELGWRVTVPEHGADVEL